MRKAIIVEDAIPPVGHFSHAVILNGTVYASGQGPQDPETGAVPDDFEAQVRQTLRNLETVLKGAGSSLADVLKMNVYLTDATRFADFNRVYAEFFPEEPPARTTVSCQLIGILVEIDCIAAVREE
ncbi:conserved hypothetical translation inhibitor protein [Oceanicola granulosus HTCC2516]|uniref:Conserved hypothetical translation inhibitor protein n=1 Tax=Oceanicola granulosus (strain ATCC BAA-861 / DSM 15982 / KCTC 12143 / HTCC2516) TaxID=314256 RepID=Q2CF34_OCEGH|nr:RidA family protein [Oceanicola granulosus]EAR51293.1 conserved hypothetical translation inhibitor protein [Oceanicola granulosus HTCC2516]